MSSEVAVFLRDLSHTRKEDITNLYSRISSEFDVLKSEIKWNAPSFKLNGSNILTFRLFPEPAFELILHFGAKKLPDSKDLRFEVTHLKHRWADSTRCVIAIDENFDWQPIEQALSRWMEIVDRL